MLFEEGILVVSERAATEGDVAEAWVIEVVFEFSVEVGLQRAAVRHFAGWGVLRIICSIHCSLLFPVLMPLTKCRAAFRWVVEGTLRGGYNRVESRGGGLFQTKLRPLLNISAPYWGGVRGCMLYVTTAYAWLSCGERHGYNHIGFECLILTLIRGDVWLILW